MNALLEVLLLNGAAATLLAGIAALVTWRLRRPALAHLVWLVVLVKLLTPPLLGVPALPPWFAAPLAPGVTAIDVGPSPVLDTTAPDSSSPGLRRDVWGTAATLWLGGVLLVALVAATRVIRFRRLLGAAPLAGPDLERRAERIARRLGLAAVPRLRLVPGRLSPMLWSDLRGCEILLPARLLRRLDAAEVDALIAHELAHVRRRDHWVRWVESLAVTLFFWHPVVWWVRRRLHVAEEQSCDALVLRALPGGAAAYAEGLLKTVEFLARRRADPPLLSTGAGETRQLEERLTMILHARRYPGTTTAQRWLFAAAAATALLIFPTWADEREAPSAADEARAAEVRELRRESLEIEREMRRLGARQQELQDALQRRQPAAGLAEQEQAERLAALERIEFDETEHAERERALELSLLATRLDTQRAAENAARARMAAGEFRDQAELLALERAMAEAHLAEAAHEQAMSELERDMTQVHRAETARERGLLDRERLDRQAAGESEEEEEEVKRLLRRLAELEAEFQAALDRLGTR